jgi:NAD(P)-dependent dehydrogenase (short-subunit alcohol dehydrogenase family)
LRLDAGINQAWAPLYEIDEEQLRTHFEVRSCVALMPDILMLASRCVNSQVNTIGTLVLFKASFELLKASTSAPKFVVISSLAGSIEQGGVFPMENAPYGITKAAVNFLARKLHTEHAGDGLGKLFAVSIRLCPFLSAVILIVIFPICPGAMDTDMGKPTS